MRDIEIQNVEDLLKRNGYNRRPSYLHSKVFIKCINTMDVYHTFMVEWEEVSGNTHPLCVDFYLHKYGNTDVEVRIRSIPAYKLLNAFGPIEPMLIRMREAALKEFAY